MFSFCSILKRTIRQDNGRYFRHNINRVWCQRRNYAIQGAVRAQLIVNNTDRTMRARRLTSSAFAIVLATSSLVAAEDSVMLAPDALTPFDPVFAPAIGPDEANPTFVLKQQVNPDYIEATKQLESVHAQEIQQQQSIEAALSEPAVQPETEPEPAPQVQSNETTSVTENATIVHEPTDAGLIDQLLHLFGIGEAENSPHRQTVAETAEIRQPVAHLTTPINEPVNEPEPVAEDVTQPVVPTAPVETVLIVEVAPEAETAALNTEIYTTETLPVGAPEPVDQTIPAWTPSKSKPVPEARDHIIRVAAVATSTQPPVTPLIATEEIPPADNETEDFVEIAAIDPQPTEIQAMPAAQPVTESDTQDGLFQNLFGLFGKDAANDEQEVVAVDHQNEDDTAVYRRDDRGVQRVSVSLPEPASESEFEPEQMPEPAPEIVSTVESEPEKVADPVSTPLENTNPAQDVPKQPEVQPEERQVAVEVAVEASESETEPVTETTSEIAPESVPVASSEPEMPPERAIEPELASDPEPPQQEIEVAELAPEPTIEPTPELSSQIEGVAESVAETAPEPATTTVTESTPDPSLPVISRAGPEPTFVDAVSAFFDGDTEGVHKGPDVSEEGDEVSIPRVSSRQGRDQGRADGEIQITRQPSDVRPQASIAPESTLLASTSTQQVDTPLVDAAIEQGLQQSIDTDDPGFIVNVPVPASDEVVLTEDKLVLGIEGNLGRALPFADDPGRHCVRRLSGRTWVCLESLGWPSVIADAFMAKGVPEGRTKAVIRYDEGSATQYRVSFPAESFDRIMFHFLYLLGEPTERPTVMVPIFAEPKRPNRVVRWVAEATPGAPPAILEMREIDDVRWMESPDTNNGVVRLYRQGMKPVFSLVMSADLRLIEVRRMGNNEPEFPTAPE